MIPFSVLDLSPIAQGSIPADALHRSLDLAQQAERWGCRRYWLAEHHNMAGIASAATAVVIGYVAIIVAGHFHDHQARLRSFEITAEVGRQL